MELPELSLALSWSRLTPECSSSESSDTSFSLKRKAISDSILERKSLHSHCNNIDLQHSTKRLPVDWEQCLDLKSGKIYFLNRKTLKKSWDRPTTKDESHRQYNSQKLDLELNMSSKLFTTRKADQTTTPVSSTTITNYSNKKDETKMFSSNDNMVAMACMNCHMLVILSKSSPICPNCKFVHSIPPSPHQTSPKPALTTTFKTLDTLSLFS